MSKPKKIQIRNSTAEFLIFTTQAGEKGIEVRVEEQTVWLTQKLIGALFDVDVRTVSEHLQNIFNSGELNETAVLRKFRNTASDGKSSLPFPTKDEQGLQRVCCGGMFLVADHQHKFGVLHPRKVEPGKATQPRQVDKHAQVLKHLRPRLLFAFPRVFVFGLGC
jgi:hypothetical protein